MAEGLKSYEKYALAMRRLLILSGLWVDPVYENKMKCLSIMNVIQFSIVMCAMGNFAFHNFGRMGSAIEAFSTMTACAVSLTKVTLFWTNRVDLVKMHGILETTFLNDVTDPELQIEMLAPLKYFYGPTVNLVRTYLGVLITSFIGPPISLIIQLVKGVSPLEYPLSLSTQYPWDQTASFGIYAIHYVLQFIATMNGVLVALSVDSVFGYYIFQIGTQFRTLSRRMRNLKSTEDYRTVIEDCVNRHQLLADCCVTLERIYGPLALIFMITSAMMICCNIFLLSKMPSGNIIAMAVVLIIAKLLQTMLYASLGLFLTTETEKYRDAIYNSGWPGSGEIPFMKDILIMLARKPLSISACGFSTISLDMFTAVTNTALSYYFLLTTIEESK